MENDYEFMTSVISYTRDKNMYNLCSDKLKANYDFVKYIINTFKDNKDNISFICEVANVYFKNNNDDITTMELILMIRDISKDIDKSTYRSYSIKANVNHHAEMSNIALCKEAISDNQQLVDEIGMGFYLIFDKYNSSPIILNYYAERFIKEIFFETEEINLEKMIHQKFDSFEKFQKEGPTKFIINIIQSYDIHLASYVACHIDTISIIKETINKIKSNWDNYNRINEEIKYETIIKKIEDYMCKYKYECDFCTHDIINFIAEELGVLDTMQKYNTLPEEVLELLSFEDIIDKENFDFTSRKHYLHIKKIMQEILKQDIVELEDDYIIKEQEQEQKPKEKVKNKIIQIDFSGKKTTE